MPPLCSQWWGVPCSCLSPPKHCGLEDPGTSQESQAWSTERAVGSLAVRGGLRPGQWSPPLPSCLPGTKVARGLKWPVWALLPVALRRGASWCPLQGNRLVYSLG